METISSSTNLSSEVAASITNTIKNQSHVNLKRTVSKKPTTFDIPNSVSIGLESPKFGKNTSQDPQFHDLISSRDRSITSQSTAHIIDQIDFVYYDEADRRSHRTHLPLGYRGFCCRYCRAAPGKSSRHFPKTIADAKKTIYASHGHFSKCPETPLMVCKTE